ncbi:MAG TPA: hypothetical protein VFN46_00580 [Acetobacteraceae bacterium]|nr:hypothetical protein [Acetobacteraceae bacterium]
MSRRILAALLACASASGPVSVAQAHVIAGVRVFPVTLTFDDPGTADEATLPQLVFQPGPDGQTATALQWEYDKTITPTTALIYNQGYDVLQQPGARARTGLENAYVTGKWQAITVPATESVVSLGVIREFAGGAATQAIGGDTFGATAPTIYAGQGGGVLPVPMLRPFAVTGELSYVLADRRLNSTLDNGGAPNAWVGGFSIQYSLPYLQSQVRDFHLPDMIGGLIPLVEVTWYSPAEAPATGLPSTLTIAPGVIYMADSFQAGLEALIPGNRATGPHVGAIAQLHVFLDDLFPNSLGRPLFP